MTQTISTTGTQTTTPLQPDPKLTGKAREAAHGIVDNVAESAGNAERKLREAATRNEAALRETAAKAKGKSEEMGQQVERFVRDHPMASAGIAFVAGLLASKMIGK